MRKVVLKPAEQVSGKDDIFQALPASGAVGDGSQRQPQCRMEQQALVQG